MKNNKTITSLFKQTKNAATTELHQNRKDTRPHVTIMYKMLTGMFASMSNMYFGAHAEPEEKISLYNLICAGIAGLAVGYAAYAAGKEFVTYIADHYTNAKIKEALQTYYDPEELKKMINEIPNITSDAANELFTEVDNRIQAIIHPVPTERTGLANA